MKTYTLLFLSICFFFGAILYNESMLKIGFWGFVIYQITIWYCKETFSVNDEFNIKIQNMYRLEGE